MPQPTFATSGGLAIVKFGNQPLPNGQGTMPYINLNDRQTWYCQALDGFDLDRQLTLGQLVYRGRAAFLADDFGPLRFALPFKFDENATYGGTPAPLGAALGQLVMAGRQFLTFDNATGLLCKVSKVGNRQMEFESYPPLWNFNLEFAGEQQWCQDLSPTTYINALALNSGSATNTNVTYAGSVWAEPVYTLTIPNANAAPIASFTLANTMSGATLAVVFPGNLAASTAWTITIDASTSSVTDQLGRGYDVAGSFPFFHGPAGQVQQIRATLTPASGTATGCTLTAVATNRWML